jgi:hypothetical protein
MAYKQLCQFLSLSFKGNIPVFSGWCLCHGASLNRLYFLCDQFMPKLTSSPSYKRRYVILYTETRDFEVAISIMETIGLTEYFCSYLNNSVGYNDELLHFVLKLDILSLSVCENFLYMPYQRKCKTLIKATSMTAGCVVYKFLDIL